MSKIDKHGLRINNKDLAEAARYTRECFGPDAPKGIYSHSKVDIGYNRLTGHIRTVDNPGGDEWFENDDPGWITVQNVDYRVTKQAICDMIVYALEFFD